MRPDSAALLMELRNGPVSAADLMRALAISQPALSRAVRHWQREGRIVRIGAARSARYALRRDVPGMGGNWPLFQVDSQGVVHERGELHLLEPSSSYSQGELPRLNGLTPGLPYYLHDQRPGGFLGRMLPAAYPELVLPARVIDWTDEHYSRISRSAAVTPWEISSSAVRRSNAT